MRVISYTAETLRHVAWVAAGETAVLDEDAGGEGKES
jgi:hypothetical protein